MTGEQILGVAALALLGPLTAALWYFDKRRSERKNNPARKARKTPDSPAGQS